MNFKNILWIILAISFAFNFGALILTITFLESNNLTELNGFMAEIFKYNYFLGFIPCIIAYIVIFLMQRHVLNISTKYTIWKQRSLIATIPIITVVLFGMDFFHDLFLIAFNTNVFGELSNIVLIR